MYGQYLDHHLFFFNNFLKQIAICLINIVLSFFQGKITMNKFCEISFVLLLVAAYHVSGDVQTSTPCSLSFYRYLFNLPGEKIRPNVPEGTYVFGKRVGPPNQEGQASELQPTVLKASQTYEAPQYLPPPKLTTTTTTTTTTPRPTTSAPLYIPPAPQSSYYSDASNTVAVVQPAKPACEHPEHQPIENGLVPPYRFNPLPKFQPQPTYQPQPTFFVPKFAPLPEKPVVVASANDIFVSQQKPVAPVHRYPVPTPPPQFLRPYSPSTATPLEKCEKHHVVSTTPVPWTTPEPLVETRQNEIVILPELVAAPHNTKDCGHKEHYLTESIGVPSTDYGVVSTSGSSIQSASAGYSYDKPSQPLAYPSNVGYTYPKPSPSFEYPGASPYSAQATALFESESPKSSVAGGIEDGDLEILKV